MFFHICIYVYDLIAVDVSNLKGFHLIVPIPQFIMSELTRHVRVNSLHVSDLHLGNLLEKWKIGKIDKQLYLCQTSSNHCQFFFSTYCEI